jgi:hypothetical protein
MSVERSFDGSPPFSAEVRQRVKTSPAVMPDARRYISAINAATRRPIRQAECHADKLQGTFGRPKEFNLVTRAKLFDATNP